MSENFYVYAYLDPRKIKNYNFENYIFDAEPFYIGKGKDDRMYTHLQEAQRNLKSSYKLNKIRKIIKLEQQQKRREREKTL